MISEYIHLSQQSAYAKERAKWEATHTQYGPPGRPYEYREYPGAMYKAIRPAQGGVRFEMVEAGNEAERERFERQGFVWGGQGKALEALERQESAIAELAANRAFTDRKMSPEAQAEAKTLDEMTIKHLPVLPEQPRKRGRPRKVATT